jgi:xanthine dehydrogenase YagT iron-sulfur-binding subunit
MRLLWPHDEWAKDVPSGLVSWALVHQIRECARRRRALESGCLQMSRKQTLRKPKAARARVAAVDRRTRALTAGAVIQGPGKVPIQVSINGKILSAQLDTSVTLLDALREIWGLTGAKRVCDHAACGACTVLLDGVRVYSCSLLAIDVQGHEITTIEAIDEANPLDPVQQAFLENDALQCGFCTAGFIMSCKGFLAENPKPQPDDIAHGLGGNICRCGTYVGIRAAVLQAAKKLAPRSKRSS